MQTNKTTLRATLAAGKTRQVIENLCALTTQDRDLHTEALALSARFQNFIKEKNAGRAEPRWLDTEGNRINAAALDLIDQLPDGPLRGASHWKKYVAIAAATVTFLGGVAAFSGYSVRDWFKEEVPKTEQVQQQPAAVPPISVSTSGANSPAVNAPNGEVHINYGEPATTKTPAKKDSLTKK